MKTNKYLIAALIISFLLHIVALLFFKNLRLSKSHLDIKNNIAIVSVVTEKNISEKKIDNENKIKNTNNNFRKKPSKNNKSSSAPRDNGISESRNPGNNVAPRDNGITESRNPGNNVAPRDNGITESRNPESSGTPKTASELAVTPKALNPETPPYPESLEEEGVEGSVTLELLISKEGKVLKAKIIKSDHELFSESALRTVKNYRFSPGKLKDGSKVDSLIEFVIKFEISL